ncbi:hypothetical protein MBAV_001982 [Candidatus Magnetobacterium bavaricum]|uniref:Uncharacterized protein n=1 Tax=Candidatus Magnetobacterium bavaricum TaxID=29290 RepID=A0A0F3GVB9_9BACT|nr:hypothetical protein MBAV_001982 [Candidatus Magnetobacterium bavaricum]
MDTVRIRLFAPYLLSLNATLHLVKPFTSPLFNHNPMSCYLLLRKGGYCRIAIWVYCLYFSQLTQSRTDICASAGFAGLQSRTSIVF